MGIYRAEQPADQQGGSDGPPCPTCGCYKSRITDSRMLHDVKRRRRTCADCGHKFWSYEGLKLAS
jgi:transcriptional regulator NrdR family protein